jgi:hypothetical protein
MVDLSEAHTLCSKSELNLVKSGFAPILETVTPSDLKSKIDSVKELHRKCSDTMNFLHSDSRKTMTGRKIELFAETIGRLEAALSHAETAQNVESPGGNHDAHKTVTEITPPENRQPEDRDSRILSALARRGEQSGQKSGSTRSQSHVGSIPRRQQGRRNSSKNH